MRWTGIAGIILLIASVLLIVSAFVTGNAELYIVLIIPVIRFQGWMGLLAIITFIAGMMMVFISFTNLGERSDIKDGGDKKGKTSWGGIVFIGPFPITFGDRKTRERFPRWWTLLLVGIIVMFILYFIAFFLAGIFL
jgi:uncharacterized protein (TIGR00304 family)